MLIEKLDLSLMRRNLSEQKTRMPLTEPHTTWDAFASGLFLGKESGPLHRSQKEASLLGPHNPPAQTAGWTCIQLTSDRWQNVRVLLRQLDVRFWECPWPRRQLFTGATGQTFFKIHFRKAGRRICRAYSEPPLTVHVSLSMCLPPKLFQTEK